MARLRLSDSTITTGFPLAAEQGNADAQYNLAWMYEYGSGVIQDNVYAHMWYNIAASSGVTQAIQARKDMAKQ